MMSLALLRVVGGVLAASVVGILVYMAFDAYGDYRVALERASVQKGIDITNGKTDAANEKDEQALTVAEAIRVAALTAAKKLPRKPQCELTADEALALGKIR